MTAKIRRATYSRKPALEKPTPPLFPPHGGERERERYYRYSGSSIAAAAALPLPLSLSISSGSRVIDTLSTVSRLRCRGWPTYRLDSRPTINHRLQGWKRRPRGHGSVNHSTTTTTTTLFPRLIIPSFHKTVVRFPRGESN